MKKIFITIVCALALCSTVSAQEENNAGLKSGSHLSFGARAGVAGFLVNGGFTDTYMGSGLALDLSYAYFFTDHVGIRIGVNASSISSGYRADNVVSAMSCNVPITTNTGTRTVLANYSGTTTTVSEDYNGLYGEIPIQLALQGNHWYANLGVKLAIPVKVDADYNYSETPVEFLGSPNLGTTVALDDELYGAQSGSYRLYDFREETNYLNPFYVMLALEGGYRIGCTCGDSWIIGLYLDYSLNSANIENPTETNLITASDGPNFTHHNVMSTNLIDSFKLFNFGVKLQYDLGLKK